MRLYAKITNEETGAVQVGTGTHEEYYQRIGMELMDVEQAETGDWYLEGRAPRKTLDELKDRAVNQLWRNYKAYQQKYVDAEDLTLATLCAAKGSEKGSVVQMWVMSLWAQYYTVRDAISEAETEEALSAIDLTAEWYGEPPYTIRELNEEAAAFLANTSGGESTTTEENKE